MFKPFAATALCLFLAMSSSAVAQQTATPHDFPGASILTGTVDQFNAACKADLNKARAEVARLKSMPAPRNLTDTLQAFDNASLAIGFAGYRSGLAQEVQPD